MTVPGNLSSPLLATAADAAAAAVATKSLRFNSGDSANLSKTFSSAGNRKTFTFSAWVKRSGLTSGADLLFAVYQDSSNRGYIQFQASTDKILLFKRIGGTDKYEYSTDAVFRDPSAWYHIVVAFDTTQATASNRVKIYVNGVEQSLTATTTAAQNLDTLFNAAQPHYVGRDGASQYFDGMMADIHFIDGSQLDATSFGAYDDNGVWQASTYSGTYGTNGFHLLDFANEPTIGNDSSGNNNDFTANNLQSSDGPIYSSGVTAYGGSLNSSHNVVSRLFDGGTTNSNRVVSSSTSGDGIKFVPSTAITGSIELYIRNGDTANSTISFSLDNGSNFTNMTTTGGDGSYVDIGSQTIGTTNGIILRHITTAGTNAVDWRAIKVDGAILVDGNFGDVMFDVPTNGDQSDTGAGGEVSGNYPTFNPISQQYSGANHVLTDGNLQVGDGSTSKGNYALEIATMAAPPSGKWYWEMTLDDANSAERRSIGVVAADADFATYLPQDNLDDGFVGLWCETGQKIINGSRTSYGASATDGDVIGVALDQDGDTVTFYKNNSSQGSISLPTNMQGKSIFPAVISIQQDENVIANFGQRPWVYSAPSNHKALCTTNLPTPTIADGSDYFEAKLYTTETTISGLSFSPDFVWLKRRSQSADNGLYDTVRGVSKILYTNSTNAEETTAGVSAFNSDGFDLGTNALFKGGGHSFVSWNWDAGSTTASNTDGTITSSVRASQTAGMSIVAYTGNNTSGATVGHGLNAEVEFAILKTRDQSGQFWHVYHSALAANEYIYLNSTNAKTSGNDFMNGTRPSSSVFTLGNGQACNKSGDDVIAYCFAPVAGFSAMGVYESNNSTDGPFIFTNFRPAFILFKADASNQPWIIHDSARNGINQTNQYLMPTNNSAELSDNGIDILSNGWKIRNNNAAWNGTSGTEYIWYAAAENPFQANGGLAR